MYPIGTKLYTSRASQITLYIELFGDADAETLMTAFEGCGEDYWMKGYVSKDHIYSEGEDYFSTGQHRVTTGKANQKWLSPAPIDDDLIEVEVIGDDGKIQAIRHDVFDFCHDVNFSPEYYRVAKIEKRTYPNDIHAPLIEWDKVELPTEERLST